jgi:hypothetical protein
LFLEGHQSASERSLLQKKQPATVMGLMRLSPWPVAVVAMAMTISWQSMNLAMAFSVVAPSRPSVVGSSKILLRESTVSTALFAKKKPAGNNVLDDPFALDEPLSMKEQMELEKKQKKEQKKQQQAPGDETPANGMKMNAKDEMLAKALAMEQTIITEEPAPAAKTEKATTSKSLSKKEQMLLKALEMEDLDNFNNNADDAAGDDAPPLSKKELKALKLKEEKMAAKMAEKLEKKKKKQEESKEALNGEATTVVGNEVNGVSTPSIDIAWTELRT